MPAPAVRYSATDVDFSPRFLSTATVTGSPQTNEEAIVATLGALPNLSFGVGAFVAGCVSLTIGTSGTAITLRIRRTNASGTVVYNSGAMTVTATNLYTLSVQGVDTGPTLPGQVYVLTAQVTGGAAASTVSATSLTVEVW